MGFSGREVIKKYLPEIKRGDKRIILINGKPVGAIARVPKQNEIRSNIHVGGSAKKVSISKAHGVSRRLIAASATSFSGEIITSIGKCSAL